MSEIKTWKERTAMHERVGALDQLQGVMQTEIDELRARVAELVKFKCLADNETKRATWYLERARKAEAEKAALEGQTVAEYQYQNTVTGRWEPFACVEDYESRTQMNIYPTRKLYLAAGAREAQPTLEAERLPMTEAEITACVSTNPDPKAISVWSYTYGVRDAEKHHEIGEPK